MSITHYFKLTPVLVIILPAGLGLYYAFNAGLLADYDYWAVLLSMLTVDGGFNQNIHYWLAPHNEHYMVIPRIIYALNIILTDGNNIFLSLYAWLAALMQLLLLSKFNPLAIQQNKYLHYILLFFMAAFCFTPAAGHNWIMGMSGVAWIPANLLSICAFVCLLRYQQSNYVRYLWLGAFCLLSASITYSTSLSALITLIIALFLVDIRVRDRLIIAGFCLSILLLYYAGYKTPSYHPAIERSLWTLLGYCMVFFGAIFTHDLDTAMYIGGFGMLFSVVFTLYVWWHKTELLPKTLLWLLILLYTGGNAFMAALARAGFGLAGALASRYASLPALFWLALLVIAVAISYHYSRNNKLYATFLVLCAGLGLTISNYALGYAVVTPLLNRAQQKPLTMAAMYSKAYDLELMHHSIVPGVTYPLMQQLVTRLEAKKHIPFNGEFAACPNLDEVIYPLGGRVSGKSFGHFDSIRLKNNRVVEIKGWAFNQNLPLQCIALVNQDKRVRGVAVHGLQRTDVQQAIASANHADLGWQGYGNIYNHDKILKVFMLTGSGKWIPMSGYFSVDLQPPYFKKM